MRPRRLLFWATMATGVLVWLWPGQERHRAAAAAAGEAVPEGFDELVEALEGLNAAWRPEARARELQACRARAASLAGPMLWVLERPARREFTAVAELSAVLPLPEARPYLADVALLAVPGACGVAALAADVLVPWSARDLEDALGGDSAELQKAMLQVCARRPHAVLTPLVALLEADDPELRRLALAALPSQVDAGCVDLLLQLVEGEGEVAAAAQAAVARLQWTDAVAPRLRAALSGVSPATAAALLAACPVGPYPEGQAPLAAAELWSWATAQDGGAATERAVALLLRHPEGDLERLRALAPALPPAARVDVARALVERADRTGRELLLDLAYQEGKDAQVARARARAELAQLSGVPPHLGATGWPAWVASGELAAPPR
jgi:hypothetical protein